MRRRVLGGGVGRVLYGGGREEEGRCGERGQRRGGRVGREDGGGGEIRGLRV